MVFFNGGKRGGIWVWIVMILILLAVGVAFVFYLIINRGGVFSPPI
ncbi:MAG: hypothetical protein ABIG28_02125 [archaeon]